MPENYYLKFIPIIGQNLYQTIKAIRIPIKYEILKDIVHRWTKDLPSSDQYFQSEYLCMKVNAIITGEWVLCLSSLDKLSENNKDEN